jgi:hypothetical protein
MIFFRDADKEKIIPDWALVKLTKIKKRPKIKWVSNQNKMITIKKLNADEYVDLKTGEVKKFKHSESRQDLLNSVSETLRNLMDLINNNFGCPEYEKYITFTYAQPDGFPMIEPKRLYEDFEKFVYKARRKFGYFDYISIVEPQGSGSLHCHVLLKFPQKVDFIPNEEVAKLWGQGFVKTKAIKNVDNLGLYLSVYLTNLEYSKVNEKKIKELGAKGKLNIIEKEVNGKSKKFIKGGRLYLYPPGINIFRSSRGIIKPEKEDGQYSIIKKKYNLNEPKFRQVNELFDKGKLVTSIYYEDYEEDS